ncbi:MAG TPA: hypothetical protein VI564_06365 [Candidatus Nanoarchaeia archaeon]|nr:hypothetical protein [Candidatus Nanoarchaeia archaeon]
MTDSNLEDIVSFYNGLISEYSEKILNGKPITYATNLTDREFLAHPRNTPNKQILEKRFDFFTESIYNSLNALNGTSPKNISDLSAKLKDDVLMWKLFGAYETAGGENLEDFKQKLFEKSGNKYEKLAAYLRVAVFLDTILKNQNLIPKVGKNSTLTLYRLFDKGKPSINEIDFSIAESMNQFMPEKLISYLDLINSYIHPTDVTPAAETSIGRYRIPGSVRLKWAELRTAEEELRDVYETKEVKKLVYDTAYSVLEHFLESCKRAGRKFANFAKNSKFAISPSEYRIIMNTIENFAVNELVGQWEKSGFERAERTYLSDKLGYTPSVRGNQLRIQIGKSGSTEHWNPFDNLKDDYTYLPMTVAVLSRIYKDAQAIRTISQS